MTEDEIEREYNRIKDEYGDAAPLWSEFLEARKEQLRELRIKNGDIMVATTEIRDWDHPGVVLPGERVRVTSCSELHDCYVVRVLAKDARYYSQIILLKDPRELYMNPLKFPQD